MNLRFCFAAGLFLIVSSSAITAQTRADRRAAKQIKADVEYLASDALEGRRTATEGERKAAEYIEARYTKEKIPPYKAKYRIPFPFVYGREILPANHIELDGKTLTLKEAFPLPFSLGTAKPLSSDVLPEVFEQGDIWMMPIYADKSEADDAHFDWEKAAYDKAREAAKQGASAVIFYDSYGAKYPPEFNSHSEFETIDIPAAFLSYAAYNEHVKANTSGISVEMNIAIKKKDFTGNNVAAYIDNKAPYTVVLGAHYDHLGYGEDGNSLYAGKDHQIHNGADDNASGTAGLLELASWLKKKKLRNYNYLFVNFSGEELGLLGSKAFVKELGKDTDKIAYMINMDMIGRLNDSTHALTVGGYGTSPVWEQFVSRTNKQFRINIDTSGVGPSDHSSFYYAGIPVLFFFTGIHSDYHKPSDDADKINYKGEVEVLDYIYSIVEVMDTRPKPEFRHTKQNSVGKVRFKVTLGIMPDYSYQQEGVRVDGVSDDRPAMKAGIKAGDIITQLGDNKIQGMQSYMEALGKFKEGDKTKVTVMRNGKQVVLNLVFQ